METDKSCFVISPIGATGSEERKRADLVLKHIYKRALEPLGYSVARADEISEPGSITMQVIERILSSDLVIADLTNHNPNVFYELAVRHASEKPVIHVIASGQKIPFDVADMRTINIDTDLEGAERSRNDIAAQAKEIGAGHSGQTPVRLAGVLKHLESSKSEDKIILRQILDGLSESRAEITRTGTDVDSGLVEMQVLLQQILLTVTQRVDDDAGGPTSNRGLGRLARPALSQQHWAELLKFDGIIAERAAELRSRNDKLSDEQARDMVLEGIVQTWRKE